MNSSTSSAEPAAAYPLFDWLRILLASVVVYSHVVPPAWPNLGNFAVCVFLALSGWLIGGILARSSLVDLPRFFYNRSLRIWAPYALAVALLYGLALARDGVTSGFARFLFHDLTFTHYWFIPKVPEVLQAMPLRGTGAHFWSISVEEQFYLFAPLIMLLLPFGRSMLLWGLICLTLWWFDYHYACIALGVLASLVRDRVGSWHLYRGARIGLLLMLMVSVLFFAVPETYRRAAPAAAIAIVLLSATEGVRSKLGSLFGGISYPLYLNHWIGLYMGNFMARVLGLNGLLHVVVSFLFAFGVAAGAYFLIDHRLPRFRNRWYTPRRGQVLTTLAYGLLLVGVIVQFGFLERLNPLSK